MLWIIVSCYDVFWVLKYIEYYKKEINWSNVVINECVNYVDINEIGYTIDNNQIERDRITNNTY